MEILTILKRDILRKKGIFICIILLTTLMVSAFLSILGVKAGFTSGIDKLNNEINTPSILAYCFDSYYDSNMKNKIENVSGVSSVLEVEAITSINNRHAIKKSDGTIVGPYDQNTYLIESFSDIKDNIKVYNDNLDGYLDSVKELKKGEIYLPLGAKNKLHCNIGDYYIDSFGLEEETIDGNSVYNSFEYSFKIVGFVASPMLGGNAIGWKEVFISDSDFNELKELSIAGSKIIKDNKLSSKENYSLRDIVYKIYSDGSVDDYTLLKRINNETKLTNITEGSMTISESIYYTGMYITIISGILVGFVIALLIVNIVVISSSVSGEIETDFKKLGILKALGFTNFKIGLIISLLYLIAEGIGFIIGLIISIFLKQYLGSIFITNTGILPNNSINILNVLIILGTVLLSSILFIFIKLLKLRKITPINAINGTNGDIYFKSRLNTPISKKALSLTLSIKQLLSSPIRYLSIIFITALLSFFMLTSIRMSNFTREDSLEAMGEPASDIRIVSYSKTPFTYELMNEIKDIANKYSEIDYMVVRTSSYVSLNNEAIYAHIHMNPEDILGIYKGRAPKYSNEFLTTKNVCDRYGLKIGDKVELSSKTGSCEFILVGIYQNTNDTGKNIAITYDGAKKIDENIKAYLMNLELKDESKVDNVLEELKSISSDRFSVYDDRNVEIPELEEYKVISDIICIIILTFAIIFTLVAIRLMTIKTFNQERLDLGIYKAVGFNSFNLRNTMALRFTLASIIGIILGIILSLLLSNQILGLMLSNLGMNVMNTNNTFLDYLLVIVIGSIVSYIGAFIASRRIKKISSRELVVE